MPGRIRNTYTAVVAALVCECVCVGGGGAVRLGVRCTVRYLTIVLH